MTHITAYTNAGDIKLSIKLRNAGYHFTSWILLVEPLFRRSQKRSYE